ncbi:MAG: hypothetical protein EKK46_00270 [Rhodocyclaceae bacterium]|nr:MAG: hypothetical protein EKK46_00270 [Rhodocyclaceae bacterium]
MSQNNRQLDDSTSLRVRRGRVESVDLYEIKDTELDTLEKGTPADLQLNFAIFLLSLAFSAIASLETATFATKAVETTFIIVSVVGILLGAYLMIAWWRARSEVKELCKKIRQRIPPDVQAADEEEEEEEEPTANAAAGSGVNDDPAPRG